jgi:hypothetical protein
MPVSKNDILRREEEERKLLMFIVHESVGMIYISSQVRDLSASLLQRSDISIVVEVSGMVVGLSVARS